MTNKDGGSHEGPPCPPVTDAGKSTKPTKPKLATRITTRVRTDSETDGSKTDRSQSDPVLWCPCGIYDRIIQKSNFEVECVVCKVWWHHKCVGLTGLTKTDCKKIAEYKCQSCFVFADEIAVKLADEATEAVPAKIEESDQGEATLNELKKGLDELKGMLITRNMAALPTAQVSEKGCSTLSVMMSDKLHGLSEVIITTMKGESEKQVPRIINAVRQEVEKGVIKIAEGIVEQKKTYADMAKGFEDKIVKVATVNKEMMESVVTTSNTKQAEITESNLNHEQWQRLRRQNNVIIRKVPECNSEDIAARVKYDRNWVIDNTDIAEGDIIRCTRPGQRREGKSRPLICQLKNEELVQRYTEHGKGSKIGEGPPNDSLYINKDLSPADQESDFLARKVRKESRSRQESRG